MPPGDRSLAGTTWSGSPKPTPQASPTQAGTPSGGGTLETADPTTATGARIIREAIRSAEGKIRAFSHTIDLPSIGANATQEITVVLDAGTCNEGDYIDFIGAESLTHGLFVQGCLPAHADDTFKMRVSNVTAGAIDQMSTTFHLEIVSVID